MKFKFLLITFCILFYSCSHLNEFGVRRNNFSIEKIKPNESNEAFKIIDTTKLYKAEYAEHRNDTIVRLDSEKNYKTNQTYLKFYNNGRVGEFRNVDLNNPESLNPKRAESYLYSFKKGKLIMQVYFKHPQCGECFIKKEIIKTSENQIVALNGDFKYTFTKIDITKNYIKFKPDW